MAPITKQELERMAQDLVTAKVIYEDTLQELLEAVEMVPQDRLKIKARIPIFQTEMDVYFTMQHDYHRHFGSIHGTTDDHRDEVRSTAKRVREASELLNLARNQVGEEDLESVASRTETSQVGVVKANNRRKLPKLSLPSFSGEVRDWLAFWSQFEEIDKDPTIPQIDKFQYLLQSMMEGSLAQKIVKSYPVSSKNYQLAVDSLKERYGREGVLVKVYVRDLLKLVIDNANKEVMDFSSLFVQLSSQLRALGTLGVTTDKCASIIFPLVECCLPEDILRAWQRDPAYGAANNSEKELDSIMEFLKKEVRGEDNIRLACGGLSVDKDQPGDKKSRGSFSRRNSSVPTTAAGLLSTSEPDSRTNCIFCGGNHQSGLCRKASKMSIEERKKIVKEKNRCYVCLKGGHSAKKCRSSTQCMNCSGRHETILCYKLQQGKPESNKQENNTDTKQKKDDSTSTATTTGLCNFTGDNKQVLLKTLCVYLHGKEKTVRARAIIDDGSQKSYILKNLAEQLQLQPVGSENVIHQLFGGTETDVQQHSKFKLKISDFEGLYRCTFNVSDSLKISGKIDCYHHGPWTEELKLHGVFLSDYETNSRPVDVLLGADVAGLLLTGKIIKLQSGPVAIQTKLGWTLIGETEKVTSQARTSYLNFQEDIVDTSTAMLHQEVNPSIDKLWTLDSLGIRDPVERVGRDQQEKMAMENFNNTVKINNEGRIEVELPWVTGHRTLPSNRWIAERKLQITTNKLVQDGKLDEYDQLFKLWEQMGFIEEVQTEEAQSEAHYLPHRAVYNPNSSSTPTRPVFNASFKKKGQPSLNDCLEKGPNLLELIPVVLTRFRLGQVGVLADIKKAFQQISVKEEDRDSCRFLWWEDLSMKKVKIYRHRRVVFGVSSSPFLLAASLKYILENVPVEKRKFAEQLGKVMYVDNLVVAVNSFEEALRFKEESSYLLSTAKMELRGWEIGPVEEEKTASLLGMKWDMRKDTMFCCTSETPSEEEEILTRRKILSVANSVFDPLGLVIPFMVKFKALVQETWTSEDKNVGWDTKLPEEVKSKFKKLCDQLKDLKKIEIPRWITWASGDRKTWSLHIYVDGSKSAYAAAAFLRVNGGESVSVQLLQARSRVSPVKQLTIPRIELMSCFIGARLSTFVKDTLECPDISTFFWTDSSTALHWIVNDGEWAVFVRNRVTDILKNSRRTEWRHVPGECNPADLPSRGCTAKQLLESRWWEGPEWLQLSEEQWPKSTVTVNQEDVDVEKVKIKKVVSSLNHSSEEKKTYEELCSLQDYETMLIHFKSSLNGEHAIDVVEEKMLGLVQRMHFFGKEEGQLRKLDVFEKSSGVLAVKTRLFYSSFDEHFRCPVVLPPDSPVVRALIMKNHLENSHGGIQFLMSKLRENYWILKIRRTIRSVIRRCPSCQRFDAKGIKVNSPPLPRERLEAETPFEVTGIDLCGQLFLKNGQKVWVVLFTCAVYRAIHLELVTSLNTASFKMALRRFVNRRGKPKMIFSDNGTNLTGCSNEMKSVDWAKIEESSEGQAIIWRFIPPAAPWWGGWWERLIGLVKDLLRRVIGQATLNQMELITILADVEGTINQRPLTYVSEDLEDLIPITPFMFLVGNKTSKMAELDEVDGKTLNKRMQYIQRMRQDLRTRFQREYLGQLNNLKQCKESPGISIGDVVLVQCDNKKRLNWPMGKVLEMYPSRDGKSRFVVVKTKEGEVRRAIQRIFPLEVPFEGERVLTKYKIPKQLSMLDLSSVTGELQ